MWPQSDFLLWLFQLRWTLIQHFQVFHVNKPNTCFAVRFISQRSCDLKARIPQRQDRSPLWSFFLSFFADHRATDFILSKICGTATKNSSHLSTVIFTTKHGDFLSEIKYLFNLEGNILHILTRNVIFFYDYSNWGELSFNIFKFSMEVWKCLISV
jgi:hypothetical protein